MTTTDAYIKELEKAGLLSKDSDYEGMIGEAVKELLLVFQKQGHSGNSAQVVSTIFNKLIKGEPLTPLTDDRSEWLEVSDTILQSTRISHVFIDKKESNRPYTIYGKAFSDNDGKSYYTSYESRVHFDLPGFPPKTEYVIVEKKDDKQFS